MRAIAALAVYVSLSVAVYAGEWESMHRKALAAFGANNYAEAIEGFRAGIAAAEDQKQVAVSNFELGVALYTASRPGEARPPLHDAMALWNGPVHDALNAARAAETLSSAERLMGNYAVAEKVLRDALSVAPAGESQGLLYCALGDLLREEGSAVAALAAFEKAAAATPLPWAWHFDVLAGMANLHRDAGMWTAAFSEWNLAAALAREHERTSLEGIALRGLGETWLAKGDRARAEPLLRRALVLFEGEPSGAIQSASVLTCLAQLYAGEDKVAMAEETLLRAIAIEERVLNDRHPQVAVLLRMLGDIESRQGNFDRALMHVERARSIMAGQFGDGSPVTATVIACRAGIEQRANRNDAAALSYREALAVLGAAGPEFASLRMQVISSYAGVLKATHRKAEASALLAQGAGFRR